MDPTKALEDLLNNLDLNTTTTASCTDTVSTSVSRVWNKQPSKPDSDTAPSVGTKDKDTAEIETLLQDLSFGSLQIEEDDWDAIDKEIDLIATGATLPPSALRESAAQVRVPKVKSTASKFEDSSEPVKFKFSPSGLAHYSSTSCEKMLHLQGRQQWQRAQKNAKAGAAKSEASTAEQAQQQPGQHSALTISEANQQRGIEFERRLVEGIVGAIDCEKEGDEDSFFRLATTAVGTTLCQPKFTLDDSIYNKAMKKAGIVFGRFIPDFIEVRQGSKGRDGKPKNRLLIIDAKSSRQVKISHQFQVTLYAIFLEHLIKINHQEDLVEINPSGGVWIPSYTEPRIFSLTFMQPVVENFIYKELPAMLSKPLQKAVWHIDSPCLQCEFLPNCKVDAKEQMTLSLVPLLSKASSLFIKSLFKPRTDETVSHSEIEDLEDLVKDRGALTSEHQERLAKIIPVPTFELPQWTDDRLLINILIDPLVMLPFACSLDHYRERQLWSSHSYSGAIPSSAPVLPDKPSKHMELTEEFIEILYDFLVHTSDRGTTKLAVFFYARDMHSGLRALLTRVISSGDGPIAWKTIVKKRAMGILMNLYEGADFLALSSSDQSVVTLPDLLGLTQANKVWPCYGRRSYSIESAIETMIVLPVIGPYTFKDIMTCLVDVEMPQVVDASERNGDGFDQDTFYSMWKSDGTPESVKESLRCWSKLQNVIVLCLYSVLRQELSDSSRYLVNRPQSFKLRDALQIADPILAQFAYFAQWEAITALMRRRQRRLALTDEEAFRCQSAYHCRYVGPAVDRVGGSARKTDTKTYVATFEVLNEVDADKLEGNTFMSWILSPLTEEGKTSRLQFDDGMYITRFGKEGIPATVSIVSYDPATKIATISGTAKTLLDIMKIKPGHEFLLERRDYFTTLITSMNKLMEMSSNRRLFLDLMVDPNKWGSGQPGQSRDVFLESITNSSRHYDMTLSQDQAFTKVINQRLQIIWGPPGSGKTEFLALMVLRFVDILRSLSRKGKGQGPQTIVITAFTHAAINNIVSRIALLHKSIAARPDCDFADIINRPLQLYRLNDMDHMPPTEGVTLISPTKLASAYRAQSQGRVPVDMPHEEDMENAVRIVCGTVWQIRRAAHPKTGVSYMRNVQMVIVDEGSQLLTSDSAHAIECLDQKRGRLVVAGDHFQLGPIILGDYPPVSPGQCVDPTGSIMKNLMRSKGSNQLVSTQWVDGSAVIDIGPCTSQLQDNFRMNEQLGTFMKSIYGPSYRVQDPLKSLPYSGSFRGMTVVPEIRKILDPAHSAICIELQLTKDPGCLEAKRIRNDSRVAASLEALFVAGTVESYLEMVGPQTATSIFIAVPHHVQRIAIREKVSVQTLAEQYPLAKIKIDTIEKMQGQQADIVLACFGMFDEAMLLAELEFLYSVHR
ncbi:hypothetical protein BGW38_008857, partial [Lunasporangiospora selenospora]